jgi:hypothetical protein
MANNIRYGLDNPHPFSQMKTELIWEGEYYAGSFLKVLNWWE